MNVGQYVQELLNGNERLWRVCLIDNQSPTALAPHLLPAIQPSLIFIPHGEPGQRSKDRGRIGLGYAVFPNALYQVAGARLDPEPAIAERLLVTTGGIDSAGISAFFVECLERVDHPRLRVSVTIGPDFSSTNIQSVEFRARESRHSWTLVREAPSLLQFASKTDLALTAGGLTKVELCAMGVPAVIIDESRDHAGDSILLNELGAAHRLGLFAELNETECVDAISSLIHDGDRREAMSKAGRAVFNRTYAETTISELEEAIQ
jgi:spore coat polysaccharide biosynthesis predicted glycosyltransferase SpsG